MEGLSRFAPLLQALAVIIGGTAGYAGARATVSDARDIAAEVSDISQRDTLDVVHASIRSAVRQEMQPVRADIRRIKMRIEDVADRSAENEDTLLQLRLELTRAAEASSSRAGNARPRRLRARKIRR